MHTYLLITPDELREYYTYLTAFNALVNLCALKGINIPADTMHELNTGEVFPIVCDSVVLCRKTLTDKEKSNLNK